MDSTDEGIPASLWHIISDHASLGLASTWTSNDRETFWQVLQLTHGLYVGKPRHRIFAIRATMLDLG
jgi:hypothetical protein